MYIKLLTLLILIGNFGQVFAQESFTPSIVEANVCKLVLDHYTKLYKSKETKTSGIIESEDVFHPEFDSREVEGISGKIKTAKIIIDGVKKYFVFHRRWHSWRGEISTGYMIDQNQTSILEEQLKNGSNDKIKPFYPMGSLAYGSNFSWWENLPFQYEKNWYVLEDFGDFYRHNSMRSIHELSLDGSTKKVCTIKIFENFSKKNFGKDFPFFTAYKETVEESLFLLGIVEHHIQKYMLRVQESYMLLCQSLDHGQLIRHGKVEITVGKSKIFNENILMIGSIKIYGVIVNFKHMKIQNLMQLMN